MPKRSPTTDPARQERRLRDLRRAILARVSHGEHDLAALGANVEASPEDEAQESTTAALLLRLDDLGRSEIAAIDAALARLRRNAYGRCTRCGNAIASARLASVPQAEHCVSCARQAAPAPRRSA